MTHRTQGVFSPAAEHTHLDEEQEKLGEGLGEGRAIPGPDAISCRRGELVEQQQVSRKEAAASLPLPKSPKTPPVAHPHQKHP